MERKNMVNKSPQGISVPLCQFFNNRQGVRCYLPGAPNKGRHT